METTELKELLLELCEDGLSDLDVAEKTAKGLTLTFMSGDRFQLNLIDLGVEGDEDDDDDEEDDDDDEDEE